MSKLKKTFVCTSCGHISPKWIGCCYECKEWNTLEEQRETPGTHVTQTRSSVELKVLNEITTHTQERLLSGVREWDRVMGGGIVPGSFSILTGDPGIGKSTLLLQIARALAEQYTVIYISSEESLEQVKRRAERLECISSKLLFSDQANLDDIISASLSHKPDLVIIDSIQNCYVSDLQLTPGSIGQLKEAAFRLMRLAKENNIAILLSGHITKDGFMAGPKTLEHMVDSVFYLQGEDRWQTRILRSVKNRFGPVNEIGFFEMGERGLYEIPNINQQLLHDLAFVPGSVLTSILEGTRPILLELQVLSIASKFAMPQRVIAGADQTQVVLIAAVLEKYLQIRLSSQDIFVKVTGGFKIKESSADLAIALGLLSSFFQKTIPEKTLVLGEISLTGQIKPVNYAHLFLREAKKFGIKQAFVSANQKITSTSNTSDEEAPCEIVRFKNVYELLNLF